MSKGRGAGEEKEQIEVPPPHPMTRLSLTELTCAASIRLGIRRSRSTPYHGCTDQRRAQRARCVHRGAVAAGRQGDRK
jgi:hypothetical protein